MQKEKRRWIDEEDAFVVIETGGKFQEQEEVYRSRMKELSKRVAQINESSRTIRKNCSIEIEKKQGSFYVPELLHRFHNETVHVKREYLESIRQLKVLYKRELQKQSKIIGSISADEVESRLKDQNAHLKMKITCLEQMIARVRRQCAYIDTLKVKSEKVERKPLRVVADPFQEGSLDSILREYEEQVRENLMGVDPTFAVNKGMSEIDVIGIERAIKNTKTELAQINATLTSERRNLGGFIDALLVDYLQEEEISKIEALREEIDSLIEQVQDQYNATEAEICAMLMVQ